MNDTYKLVSLKFELLGHLIKTWNSQHYFDINVYCESFYMALYNLFFNGQLVNANIENLNEAGIDLVSKENKLVVQVSSQNTKTKIKHSLKEASTKYSSYHFQFICISGSLKKQRDSTFDPQRLIFDPKTDLLDNKSFLDRLQTDHIKLNDTLKLFDSFFPWMKVDTSDESQKRSIDNEMLIDFMEWFSMNLMQDFLSNKTSFSSQLLTSYCAWGGKFSMHTTRFYDRNLDSLIRSFYNAWTTVMNSFNRSEVFRGDRHYFIDPEAIGPFNHSPLYNQLMKEIEVLETRYCAFIDYILNNSFILDLQRLSERFEQNNIDMGRHIFK